jgi:hypothetical protein
MDRTHLCRSTVFVGGVLLVAGGIVAASAGCGGGDALSNASGQIAEAVCPKAYECCTADKLMKNDLAGTDVASCKAMTRDEFSSQFEGVRDSQRRGRAEFDQAKFDQCLEIIRASSCDFLNMTNHLGGVFGCDGFVIPKVAPGGACFLDWDCIGGWCDHDMSSGTDGVCRAGGTAGQDCEFTSECADGLECQQFKCTMLRDESAMCTYNEDCKSGTCDVTVGMPTGKICLPSPPDPTRCFYESACSYAGSGRSSLVATLGGAAVAVALLSRRRRRGRSLR